MGAWNVFILFWQQWPKPILPNYRVTAKKLKINKYILAFWNVCTKIISGLEQLAYFSILLNCAGTGHLKVITCLYRILLLVKVNLSLLRNLYGNFFMLFKHASHQLGPMPNQLTCSSAYRLPFEKFMKIEDVYLAQRIHSPILRNTNFNFTNLKGCQFWS